MKSFDKENVHVSFEDCFRWSRKMVARMQELHERTTLTQEEQEEYRMAILVAALLDDAGHDLLETADDGAETGLN